MRNATVQEQDRHVWRPDLFGSTLFLVASTFGILALGSFWSLRPRSLPWQIAWFNMVGSILFMASALASFVLPSSGDVINTRITVAGTLLRSRVLPDRSRPDVSCLATIRATGTP